MVLLLPCMFSLISLVIAKDLPIDADSNNTVPAKEIFIGK